MFHRAVELRERADYLERLAFWTIPEEGTGQSEARMYAAAVRELGAQRPNVYAPPTPRR